MHTSGNWGVYHRDKRYGEGETRLVMNLRGSDAHLGKLGSLTRRQAAWRARDTAGDEPQTK